MKKPNDPRKKPNVPAAARRPVIVTQYVRKGKRVKSYKRRKAEESSGV